MIGDDYPGISIISADGRKFVYGDHSTHVSPHYTPALIARDTSDGSEVGNWALDGVITFLEASGKWIIACETNGTDAIAGENHDHVVAINWVTGEIRRVETWARVFLPTQTTSGG